MFPQIGPGDCSGQSDGFSSFDHDDCPDNPPCPPGIRQIHASVCCCYLFCSFFMGGGGHMVKFCYQ